MGSKQSLGYGSAVDLSLVPLHPTVTARVLIRCGGVQFSGVKCLGVASNISWDVGRGFRIPTVTASGTKWAQFRYEPRTIAATAARDCSCVLLYIQTPGTRRGAVVRALFTHCISELGQVKFMYCSSRNTVQPCWVHTVNPELAQLKYQGQGHVVTFG
jgi:hypothetical protein